MTSGIRFRARPNPEGQRLLGLLHQLDRSQWLPPEQVLRNQLGHLKRVLDHAYRTVPYYRQLYDDNGIPLPTELDPDFLSTLPIMTRIAAREAGDALHSRALPRDHGAIRPVVTSGSTGNAVRLHATESTNLIWHALTLRDHLWHERDFGQKLAAIRWYDRDFARAPNGARRPSWGRAVEAVYISGPCVMLHVATPLAQQIDWLRREQPCYLLSFPSNVAALAAYCLDRNIALPSIREVRTVGETLTHKHRSLCEQAWGCKVVDLYSCEEAGYLALQCPEQSCYHVQAENVMLEVVDSTGRACKPGESGRVLITTLHNYATPLVRYEVGDYVEVGRPCGCGRGLPVLQTIQGRIRNRLVFPDGRSEFPYLGEHGQITKATGVKVRGFQFIQHTTEEVELKLVTDRPFTEDEALTVQRLFQKNLGHPFRITITRCDDIPKGPREKFEEFISKVAS